MGGYHGRQTFHVLPDMTIDIIAGIILPRKAGFQWSLPNVATLRPTGTGQEDTGSRLAACSTTERRRLQTFLEEILPKFEQITGTTHLTEHCIRLKPGQEPIRQRYRSYNPAMQGIIDTEIDKMLKDGCIEPTSSP